MTPDPNFDRTFRTAMECKLWIENWSSLEHNVASLVASVKGHPDLAVSLTYPDRNYRLPLILAAEGAARFFHFMIRFDGSPSENQAEVTVRIMAFSHWKGKEHEAGATDLILNVP